MEDDASASESNPKAAKFNHPYAPYDVQMEFMRTVYDILEKGGGQVGILESPTGTGKSLSLICATLSWLRAHKAGQHESSLRVASDEAAADEPAWVAAQLLARRRAALVQAWEDREARLAAVRARERREDELAANPTKRRRVAADPERGAIDEEREFMLDDDGGNPAAGGGGLSAEARDVLARMGLTGNAEGARRDADGDEVDDDGVLDGNVKIYFASRTHSQLTQFIAELRRPSFPPSIPPSALQSAAGTAAAEPVRLVPLSSRQRLCVNPAVASLSSLGAINDACSELQRPKSTKARCPFLPTAQNATQTRRFRDAALATLPDVEDLHRLGVQHAICPYYGSRAALAGAEIVALPYPLLLQRAAREALGIRLDGAVVVIDEAHNVMDAIAATHATSLRLGELRRARGMLAEYARRFGKRLGPERRVLVGRVARVVDGLTAWLTAALDFADERGVVNTSSLLTSQGIDQINLFELIRGVHESKLAFKVEGYAEHLAEDNMVAADQDPAAMPRRQQPVLHTLVAFLGSLTDLSSEGRIFYQKLPSSSSAPPSAPPSAPSASASISPPGDVQLSYLLLSPTHAFSSVASAARAVILAGGTMSPFADYAAHLFPSHPASKITTLSCRHVVPAENVFVWTLTRARRAGPEAHPPQFDFTFAHRSDAAMIHELGLAILNMCAAVPDGVVVFFPSYGYLDQVIAEWQRQVSPAAERPTIWSRLEARKPVFRETRAGSSEELLQAYSDAILGAGRGALLLSVVGGRLSEGINFSDRLGRCVIVVGLPYPNPSSPEWVARAEYLEATALSRITAEGAAAASAAATTAGAATEVGDSASAAAAARAKAKAKAAAREFYDNACLRAVNQSVGRVIRHRGDYAAIVLVDRRFGTEPVRAKLSGWVRDGIRAACEAGGVAELMGGLSGFFRKRQDLRGR